MISKQDSKEKFVPLITLVIVVVVILLLSITISYSSSTNAESKAQVYYDVPAQSFLFVGEIADRESEWQEIYKVIEQYNWDLVTLGGDTVRGDSDSIGEYVEDLSKTSKEVRVIKGEKDKDKDFFTGPGFFSYIDRDVQHIFLDTTDENGIVCNLGVDQESFLENAISTQVEHRIVYMHNALWVGDAESERFRVNNQVDCANDYWWDRIHPLFEERVDIVIAGDGRNFNEQTFDGVRYILNGNIKRLGNDLLMQFTRVTLQGDQLLVTPFKFANPAAVDTTTLDQLPTFEVTVDSKELKNLNTKLPFHDINQSHWLRRLNAEENIKFELPGKVIYEGEEYEINLVTAGKAGNHRLNPKKSWNIEFLDEEFGGPAGREKLIFRMPGDRGYINQQFVNEINKDQGLITPDQFVGRLIINGIDYGPYSVYEDFDKVFTELNQFNSDVTRGESVIYDEFASYPTWDDLNHIKQNGKVRDISLLQKMTAVSESDDARDFLKFFEEENYRKWIASQIFTGNRHQSSTHNLKFFLDRATGRIVFVAWDQYYDSIRKGVGAPLEHFGPETIQYKVLEDPIEREAVLAEVGVFLSNRDEYRSKIVELRSDYEEVFLNDPYTTKSISQIKRVFDVLEENFEDNNLILEEFLLE